MDHKKKLYWIVATSEGRLCEYHHLAAGRRAEAHLLVPQRLPRQAPQEGGAGATGGVGGGGVGGGGEQPVIYVT